MVNRRNFIATSAVLFVTLRGAQAGNISLEPPLRSLKLISAAQQQIGVTLSYDPSYSSLKYPGGDVPLERGVCTDVIIRAYRTAFDIDFQQLVHEDMMKDFSAYPTRWGLKKPDSNIDHRRVPNLQTYFQRHDAALKATDQAADYRPGDIITVDLPGHLPHIGLVTHHKNIDGSRPLCIHNIGDGAKFEDLLFAFPITGHYRFKL